METNNKDKKDKPLGYEQLYLRDSKHTNNAPGQITSYAKALPYVFEKSVTDLCCGLGYGTKLLAEAANVVIGYDYQESAIDYANNSGSSNCIFEYGDLDKDIWSIVKMEGVITCFQGLEHLDDPGKIVKKIIKEADTFIFAVPNESSVEGNRFHHHTFTEESIRGMFPTGTLEVHYGVDGGNIYEEEPETFNFFWCVWSK